MTTTTLDKAQRRARKNQLERTDRQQLLNRAIHLPTLNATIISAHLDRGLSARELAVLHGMSPRQMRRRLDRLKSALADPCFLLAAEYARKLPPDLQPLARAYWLEGRSLRELSASRHQTLHRIRQQILLARSLLLVSLSADRPLARNQAQSALDPHFTASSSPDAD